MNLKDPEVQKLIAKAKQGNCTKAEAALAMQCVDDMFSALPKAKKMEFIGELNEVFLFLGAVANTLPEPS